MRRVTDFNKEELVTLKQDEIDTLIDLEVAYAGIKKVDKPEPFVEQDFSKKRDITVYKVANFLFKNREDAERVTQMPMYELRYTRDYTFQFAQLKEEPFGVVKDLAFSEQTLMPIVASLARQKQEKKAWEDAEEEYARYKEAVASCVETVMQPVREARAFMKKVRTALEQLNEYTKLADGNSEIARNFLKKTYANDEEVLTYVLAL